MSKFGVSLRVTEWGNQGGRAYMEDRYAVHFERNENGETEFAYFGIFDGHGGAEAAKFARDNLLGEITKYDEFWTDNDKDVCESIKIGFLDTHHAMWKEIDNWPRTQSGFASTAGTTASIAIIKNCKLYIGHVGDSGIVLGYHHERDNSATCYTPILLTKDHKPESPDERRRIEQCGGSVELKSGIQRVVWNRPKRDHQGPVRRSTPIDRIPFLAVARSLGDLWSYDYTHKEFAVSPEPDVSVQRLFPSTDKCLILGTDGLWNMISPGEACLVVHDAEREVENKIVKRPLPIAYFENTAQKLVWRALQKWTAKRVKADNVTAVVVMIEPSSTHRATKLRRRCEQRAWDLMVDHPPPGYSPMVDASPSVQASIDKCRDVDVVSSSADASVDKCQDVDESVASPPAIPQVRQYRPFKSLSDSQLLRTILEDESDNVSWYGDKILTLMDDSCGVPSVGSEVTLGDEGASGCDVPLNDVSSCQGNDSPHSISQSYLNLTSSDIHCTDQTANSSNFTDIRSRQEHDLLRPPISGKQEVVLENRRKIEDGIYKKDFVYRSLLITKNHRIEIVREYLLNKQPSNAGHHHPTSKLHKRRNTSGNGIINGKSPKVTAPHMKVWKKFSSGCKRKKFIGNVSNSKMNVAANGMKKADGSVTDQLTTFNPFHKLKHQATAQECRERENYISGRRLIKRSVSAPTSHDLKRVHACLTALTPGDVKAVLTMSGGNSRTAASVDDEASNQQTYPAENAARTSSGFVLRNCNKVSPVKASPVKCATIGVDQEQVCDAGGAIAHRVIKRSACHMTRRAIADKPRDTNMVRRLRSAIKRKKTRSPIRNPVGLKRLRRSCDVHSR